MYRRRGGVRKHFAEWYKINAGIDNLSCYFYLNFEQRNKINEGLLEIVGGGVELLKGGGTKKQEIVENMSNCEMMVENSIFFPNSINT